MSNDPPVDTVLGEITIEQYWSLPGWHSGELKDGILCSGRAFYAKRRDPKRKCVVTDAMKQGALVDCLLTQPHRFEQRYCVLPADLPRRPTAKQLTTGQDSKPGTKAHSEWINAQSREREWQEFEIQSQCRELIPLEWMITAERIREVVLADPDCGPLFADAMPSGQEGFRWIDEGGHVCCYLPDLETQSGGLWDLKKARDAAPRPSRATAFQRAYDIQSAHYGLGYEVRHGQPPDHYGFIFFDWDPPHETLVLDCTPDFVEMGLRRREEAFERIHHWDSSGVYPSHPRAELAPPPWMRSDAQTTEPFPEIQLF